MTTPASPYYCTKNENSNPIGKLSSKAEKTLWNIAIWQTVENMCQTWLYSTVYWNKLTLQCLENTLITCKELKCGFVEDIHYQRTCRGRSVHIQCTTAYPVFENETLQRGDEQGGKGLGAGCGVWGGWLVGHKQVGKNRLDTQARMGNIRFIHTHLNNLCRGLDQT